MAVVAWNYHYMVRRCPGEGGTFGFVMRAFGGDHAILCAWFLILSYVSIIWANATALTIMTRCLFGDALRFGFHYSLAGFDIALGDVLLSVAAILVAAAICCRRVLAGRVEAALAAVFATGIAVCFAAAAWRHDGGLGTLAPAFSADGGAPLVQVLRIVAFVPWLFLGFESVSHLSGEFRFPLKKTFGVMAAAVAASVVAYSFLALMPDLMPAAGGANWSDALAHIDASGRASVLPTLEAARLALGKAGTALFTATIVGAVFTNLVGNMVVASRLAAAMTDAGAFPKWLGRRDGRGEPRNAIVFFAGVSCLVPFLGRTAIGFIVDVSTIGAIIAYAYTSAAAYKEARADGNGTTKVVGLLGLVLSVTTCLLFAVPSYFADTMMATESYLILILWCIFGFLYYLSFVLRRDRRDRYGRSTAVWLGLVMLILFMSHMWVRQGIHNATKRALEELSGFVAETAGASADDGWRRHLSEQLERINGSTERDGFVQVGLMSVAFGIMFGLFSILRRRERRLEQEKAMAKSYFFSTVSHDIRTPLNAIIGYSEMLKSGMESKAERDQALDSILVSGRMLLGLINDVLDLSKLEVGKMEIALEPTDCPRLLKNMTDALRVAGGKPAVELRCREEDMPLLMLDPQRIRQILFNLMSNGLKFTEKGYVELRAKYARAEGGETGVFRIDVEDSGCGIGEEDIRRIGAAYVQIDSKLARNGGTGLGLAISNQLAVAMGGKISVVSALGRGSTFSLVIPGVKVAKASPLAAGGERAPARTAEAKPLLKAAEDGRPRRILLVDDSKMNLMVLRAQLKKLGDFETELAADGKEALDMLTDPAVRPFDLVMTDMWMPNLDGEGLLKAVRGDPAIAATPVVVVTADVELRGKFAEMGFDGLLLKPVTAETLGRIFSGGERG